jgi:preprotein translocase SecE subunit
MNLSNYLKEVVRELKLSTFPTQNVVVNFTIFVIVFTAAMASYLGVLDVGFGKGVLSLIEILKTSDFAQNIKPVVEAVQVATSTATSTI